MAQEGIELHQRQQLQQAGRMKTRVGDYPRCLHRFLSKVLAVDH